MNKICAILIFLFVYTLGAAEEFQRTTKPNIIFILTDDHRFDGLGFKGNKLAYTPEMDQLAEKGTFFHKAMSSTPICSASRASILSGLHERTHRYTFQSGDIQESYMKNAYPKLLKNAGYQTAFYGKYGIQYDKLSTLFSEYEIYDRNTSFPDRRGYYYKTIGKDTVHLTEYTGHKALQFLDKSAATKPFCLMLNFSAPHAHDNAKDQYFWQKESDDLLKNEIIPQPDLSENTFFDRLPEPVKRGFNRTRWAWRFDTPEKYQQSVKGYYRMIADIDRQIGKIRKKLGDIGLDKNTVIILMGDNGYFLGERQLADKWLMYDQSVRVPLIIYDPRLIKQKDSDIMALNIDIPTTIADLAKIDIPKEWQGKSLLPLLKNNPTNWNRDTVLLEHLWEFKDIPPSEGVRTNDWKYFRYVNDKSNEELYDLKNDPREINNLAKHPDHKHTLIALRNKCNHLIEKYSDENANPPYDLSIEYIRKPQAVLIKDPKPEFSWIVPKEAVMQSAYQILIASSVENLNNNIGDIWNSGQVRSQKSFDIEYAGQPLAKGTKYFWKVRIWDEGNRLSNYSESQYFQIGSVDNTSTTANVFQIDRIKPSLIKPINNKSYFIDFGKAAFANMEIVYHAHTPHTITIRVGEQLENNKINRKPIGHIRYASVDIAVTPGKSIYTLPLIPDKRNTKPGAVVLPDSFPVLLPFRYVEIENVQGEIEKNNFTQLAYHSYWDDNQSHFSSSDDILNQVWEMCRYSIKATTFAGLYVDGDRERIPYEADAYLNQLSHYTTDREYAIARRTIEYFMEYPTWPTEWQQHMALMFYADYQYTGNTELIKKYYEPLKYKTLYELRRDDGLISSAKVTPQYMEKLGFKDPTIKLQDIVDWPSAGWGGDPTILGERDGYVFMPYNTVINCLYYKNMLIMTEFAKLLGKTNEALEFELLALQAKISINEKLFDKNKGAYIDGEGTDHASLHANMMALAFDLVPKEYLASVLKFVKSRGMACSVYGSQYLLEGLYNANEADYALDLMTAQHDRSWYNMIKVGSTIALEAWDMKYKPNADWNHAWGATPANIIPRYLWGIQPKTPGYDIAQIKPQMSKLKNSAIEVPTIKGNIKAEYQWINNNSQRYTIELPANMVAEFELINMQGKVIKLNGEKKSLAFGTVQLMPGVNTIEVAVNTF